jgi:hypothetical protein
MFLKKKIAGVMHRRLPPFERPQCAREGCPGQLLEPKPFHTEPQGAPGVFTARCLAKCERCGAAHAGTRTFGVGKQTRAFTQEFHLYNDADRDVLRALLPKFQNNQPKLAQINAMPVND